MLALRFSSDLAQEPPPRPQLPPGTLTGVPSGERDGGAGCPFPTGRVLGSGGGGISADGWPMGCGVFAWSTPPGAGGDRVTRWDSNPGPGGPRPRGEACRWIWNSGAPPSPLTGDGCCGPCPSPLCRRPGGSRGAGPGSGPVGGGRRTPCSGLAEAGLATAAGVVSGSPGDPRSLVTALHAGSATEQKADSPVRGPVGRPLPCAGDQGVSTRKTVLGAGTPCGWSPARFEAG